MFSGSQAGWCLISPTPVCVCRTQMPHRDNRRVFHQRCYHRVRDLSCLTVVQKFVCLRTEVL